MFADTLVHAIRRVKTCALLTLINLCNNMQVEFINLKGSSYENPAVCKYTGNKWVLNEGQCFVVLPEASEESLLLCLQSTPFSRSSCFACGDSSIK